MSLVCVVYCVTFQEIIYCFQIPDQCRLLIEQARQCDE